GARVSGASRAEHLHGSACAIGASLLARIAPMAYIRAVKIVRTRRYKRDLKQIGASAADISALETAIASDPTVGDAIPGLGGLRKIRFGIATRDSAAADGRSTSS